MTRRISQLKSYKAFRAFLYRTLKGCSQLHLDKLINHLYSSYVNDFGVNRASIATLTKKQFFGDKIGMGRWLKALDKALVIRRTAKNASTFYVTSKGIKYLGNIYKEVIVIEELEVYIAQNSLISTDTGGIKTVKKLESKIDDLQKDMKFLISMMTKEQKEEVERHLTLVIRDGEPVK